MQPRLLRDWYLAEFHPETANEGFYRSYGIQRIRKIPQSVNLLVHFRESEPEAAFVHAGLAAYYVEHGQPKSALELLKEIPDLEAAMQDPFVVAVMLEALVDLGESERAKRCMQQFPVPHSGYLYWRAEGNYRDYLAGDAAGAIESYRKALATWPASFDWELMTRLAECLRKSGQVDEADAIQALVDELTSEVLTKERTSRLRDELRNLDDPEVAAAVRDLYQEFGLTREAEAWELHRRHLLNPSSS